MGTLDGRSSEPKRAGNWPHYDGAKAGLRNYWYPAAWSKAVQTKPVSVQLLDEPVVLLREHGRVYALFDQCPHRGIPLSVGRREFPGTWTCRYHGWTFDLQTGVLKAAITDGPGSPICGKVRVKTYPVEERLGLIWVYMGEGVPPPVEADIPEEFFQPHTILHGRVTLQRGNWRYACENAFDEGHVWYLHRYGVVRTLFTAMPSWSKIKVTTDDQGWITREIEELGFSDDYPGLGRWPRKPFWKWRRMGARVSMRLPCILRVQQLPARHSNYAWYVPAGTDCYHYWQFYFIPARGLDVVPAQFYYWTYFRWAHFVQFNRQDTWMVELMPETAPERLYRPDVSITAWRKLCEQAREPMAPQRPVGEEAAASSGQAVVTPAVKS